MTIRIGVLGAARIAPNALMHPARAVPDVEVSAVAARDHSRAERFARRWAIPRVLPNYQAIVDDRDVDAVYIPLPNGLHAEWALAAIAAGKHVLCEKPFASNASQAKRVADAAAARPELTVMEAFHYRYHPLMHRVVDLLRDGAIGELREVRAALCFPLPRFNDIRYNLSLAGGALMDAGCYPVHCVRTLAGVEPEVVSATALLRSPGVDRAMEAVLKFPDGAVGRVRCSMWSRHLLSVSAKATGTEGSLAITNYLAPSIWHRLRITSRGRTWTERVAGEPTYTHQLRAFAAALGGNQTVLTSPTDAVANMTVIDSMYRAAGLRPRR
jgi:predicted dehydrogenase